MPRSGPAPKEDGTRRRTNASTFEWVDVENIPYTGDSPELPDMPADDDTSDAYWHPQTTAWYNVVRALPHAVNWDAGMWQEIASTALIHTAVWNGDTVRSAELRIRERNIGLTADARLDLRIRYVEPKTTPVAATQNVTPIRRNVKPRANALGE